MSKWTQTEVNSRAPGTVSFGQDTDQSVVADPWLLDSAGVQHWAAPNSAVYDTALSRSAAGVLAVNGAALVPGAPVTGPGATVTGVTAKTLLATGSTVPANTLATGQAWEFEAWGVLTTTVNTQTVTLELDFGGLAGTVLVSSGTQNPNNSGAVTNQSWWVRGVIECTAAGTMTAMIYDHMSFVSFSIKTAAGVAVTNTVDTAIVLAVTPSATAVSITCQGALCERKA